MEAAEIRQATTPEPLRDEDVRRRQSLEDNYESIVLEVMALEEEWMLDDRIAYAVRHAA